MVNDQMVNGKHRSGGAFFCFCALFCQKGGKKIHIEAGRFNIFLTKVLYISKNYCNFALQNCCYG